TALYVRIVAANRARLCPHRRLLSQWGNGGRAVAATSLLWAWRAVVHPVGEGFHEIVVTERRGFLALAVGPCPGIEPPKHQKLGREMVERVGELPISVAGLVLETGAKFWTAQRLSRFGLPRHRSRRQEPERFSRLRGIFCSGDAGRGVV